MKLLRIALTTLLFLMVAGTALAAGRLEPGTWPGAELAKSGPVAVPNQVLKTTAGITLTAASPSFTGTGTVTVGSNSFTIGVDAFATIQRQVEQIVTHMLDLGKKTQQVGMVLEIVAGIQAAPKP